MAKDISQAVREVCLWLPEAEEYLSHGSPNFRVRGKTFATYAVNQHGDGRIALWLNSPMGAQQCRVGNDPHNYFVPPYVGPRGWIGVHLDRGLNWDEIAALVREAYEKVAPPVLTRNLGTAVSIDPPTTTMDPAEFDPLSTPLAQAVLGKLRELCLDFPETSEALSFGTPIWRTGKKSFANLYAYDQRMRVAFWVGIEMQGILTADPRFEIPAYMGHNGWIALNLDGTQDWDEITALARQSYRHYASKRALARLDGNG